MAGRKLNQEATVVADQEANQEAIAVAGQEVNQEETIVAGREMNQEVTVVVDQEANQEAIAVVGQEVNQEAIAVVGQEAHQEAVIEIAEAKVVEGQALDQRVRLKLLVTGTMLLETWQRRLTQVAGVYHPRPVEMTMPIVVPAMNRRNQSSLLPSRPRV